MLRSPLLKRLMADGKEAEAKPEKEFESDGKGLSARATAEA